MKQIDISNGELTVLIALDEDIHLVAFDKSQMDILEQMIKRSIQAIVPTGVTQYELNELLNYQPKGEPPNAEPPDRL